MSTAWVQTFGSVSGGAKIITGPLAVAPLSTAAAPTKLAGPRSTSRLTPVALQLRRGSSVFRQSRTENVQVPSVASRSQPGSPSVQWTTRKWGGRLDGSLSWDAFLLHYRNTPAVRAALTEAPLVLEDGRGRLVALLGAAGAAGRDLQAHVRQLDTAGLAELACLVEGETDVGGDFGAPHSSVRAVPPGEVWPAASAA